LVKIREPFNGISHLVAAILSAGGLVLLLVLGWEEPLKRVSLSIYGLTLVLMFAASTAYHSIHARPEIMLHLKRFDHTAIYLLIAGSYTPVCLHYFSGFWRLGLLILIWILASIGITVKLFLVGTPRWITAGVYLFMGWLAMLAISEIVQTFPPGALLWLVLGGFFFTVGAMIYIFKKPDFLPGKFGFHEIWHIFVILGAFSHFILVALYIAPSSMI
jgi:hemolysin III